MRTVSYKVKYVTLIPVRLHKSLHHFKHKIKRNIHILTLQIIIIVIITVIVINISINARVVQSSYKRINSFLSNNGIVIGVILPERCSIFYKMYLTETATLNF